MVYEDFHAYVWVRWPKLSDINHLNENWQWLCILVYHDDIMYNSGIGDLA